MIKYEFIFVFIISFLFSCSNPSEVDYNVFPQNPAVISYDKNRENKVNKAWEEFRDTYNYPTPHRIVFDPVTSFIKRLCFIPNLQIFKGDIDNNDTLTYVTKLTDFINKWEDLFGGNSDNLEFSEFKMNIATFNVNFKQTRLSERDVRFTYERGVSFDFDKDGGLFYIINSTVPDVNLYFPNTYDFEKMKKYIYKHIIDDRYANRLIFDKDDHYELKDDFCVYKYEKDNKYYIYVLKEIYAIDAKTNFFHFSIFCHPETGKIIYVKKQYYL